MTILQQVKVTPIIPPAARINNASAAILNNSIDTFGFKYLAVIFELGATDILATACKLQESESASSGFVDIAGTVLPQTINGVVQALPTATDGNKTVTFYLAIDGLRMRYIKPVFTFGNGTLGGFVSAVALLSRANQAPYSTTTRGNFSEIIL